MRFPGRRRKPPPPPEATVEPPAPTFLSRALESRERWLRSQPGRLVTDLGPAVQANLEQAARWKAVYQVLDLVRSPDDLPAVEPAELVLGWDVLPYLKPGWEAWLASAVAPNGLLYVVAPRVGPAPVRPCRFRLGDASRVVHEGVTSGPGGPSLIRLDGLEGFTLEHSYLLKHGWEEHLLRRDA